MTHGDARLAVRPATDIGPGATVRDYDELDERTKVALSGLRGEAASVEGVDLAEGDVVRFTAYYRVEARPQAAGD